LVDILFRLSIVNVAVVYVVPEFVTLIYSNVFFLTVNVVTSNVTLLSVDAIKSVLLSVILLVPPTLK
jgi:hypothetical protein